MKYYVIRTTKNGIEYKKYKCIDGWSKSPADCWKFSKAGARKIAERLNKACNYNEQAYPKKVHYNTLEVVNATKA